MYNYNNNYEEFTHLKSIIFKMISKHTDIYTNSNISLTNEMNDILFTYAYRSCNYHMNNIHVN